MKKVRVGDVEVVLTDEQADDLRRQLGVSESDGERLLDAAEVARWLGVSREHVYRHAAELGAVRLGEGPKGRLRFNPTKVEAVASANLRPEPQEPKAKAPKRRSRKRRSVRLLEVRGEGSYAGPANKQAPPGDARTSTGGLTKGGYSSDG